MKNHVFLRGGMGNQFFQWLYAMELSYSHNSVVLDTSFLRKISGNQGAGELELKIVLEELKLPLQHTAHIWRFERILTRIGRLFGVLQTDLSPPLQRSRYYYGYYQRPPDMDSDLISQAKKLVKHSLRTPPIQLNAYAAIHVRGGDYQKSRYNRTHIGLLEQDYYDKVFHLLQKEYPNISWIVVSDDYARARQIVPRLHKKNTIFLDNLLDGQETPYTAFQVLLNAEVLFCANSSFSAMAGYLGNATAVYAPNPWFKSTDLEHINPTLANWHTIAAHH